MTLSKPYLGAPYAVSPLTGSAATPEVFTSSRDGFDCVTFVETAYALALSDDASFPDALRALRYENGEVAWRSRNHYMTDWIANAERAGWLTRAGLGVRGKSVTRTLRAVPGLPPRRREIRYIPAAVLRGAARRLRSGDLVCFLSTREDLDVFHCGIVVRKGGAVLLRHATKSRGVVVEERLSAFLDANPTPGLIVARPTSRKRDSARS